jgi:predicted phosphate transport protein (TIGR00153 family)
MVLLSRDYQILQKIYNMNFSSLLKYFIPKERKFYGMFNNAAANSVEASKELIRLFKSSSLEESSSIRMKIRQIEKLGDEITNNLFDQLNRTFITPFDREDIHELTSKIDDVVDLIYSLSGKVEFFKFNNFSSYMMEMGDLIYTGSLQMQNAIAGLENSRNATKSLKACKELRKIESQIDEWYHKAISDLFEREKDAIELIKQKEILQNIEKISNKMEDVSDVVKTIIVKYA